MLLIIAIILLLLLVGGGWGYGRYGPASLSPLGLVIVILIVLWLLGWLRI